MALLVRLIERFIELLEGFELNPENISYFYVS